MEFNLLCRMRPNLRRGWKESSPRDVNRKVRLTSPELFVSPLVPSSPVSPVFPPSLHLLPPLTACSSFLPPLVLFSPSSAPSLKCMDPIRSFRPPAPPKLEDLLAPPPASEPNTPPHPVDASPLSWLLPPSAPPETFRLKTQPGSLVPQALTWSDVVQPAPSVSPGSPFPPPSPPSSSVTPPPSQSSGSRTLPRLYLGLQIQQCQLGSSACQLHLDLHHRWHLHRPSPGWRLSTLHYGVSRPRLHPGASLWLVSGPASGSSCFRLPLGSSHSPLPLELFLFSVDVGLVWFCPPPEPPLFLCV